MIETKLIGVNDGEIVIAINYNSNVVTVIDDINVTMYRFNREELIADLLEIAPGSNLDDFICSILQDDDLIPYHFTELKYM